jgi:sugar lactone lactonase YvrE
MKFKLAFDSKCLIAETPIWDPRIKKLYWTDLFKGEVHRYDPGTGIDESVKTNMTIGAAIPCETLGKLLISVDRGIMLLDFGTGRLDLKYVPEPRIESLRYNDTRCDKAGRIFTSTVSKKYGQPDFNPEKMTGKFFMVDVNGKIVTLVDKIIQYNTILFNNENTEMYVIDTYYKMLLKFNYSLEHGAWGKPQVVINFSAMPDGAAVDSDDNIYVAHWDERKFISVYSLRDFRLKRKVAFPVKNICCPCFGGDDMRDFYVTTASYWLPENDKDIETGAGGIFKTRNQTAGKVEIFYKDKK